MDPQKCVDGVIDIFIGARFNVNAPYPSVNSRTSIELTWMFVTNPGTVLGIHSCLLKISE